jgi:RimJ/RimL family protein N-acetyltransferase
MIVLETERLVLRRIDVDDAPFILRLLNEPSFLRFIGDKGVRNLDDARAYIVSGPLDMYARFGHGLYLVKLRDGTSIGMCGLIRRATLADADIGFAFLPEFWGRGYAYEAARAVLDYGARALGLTRIVAIASQDNLASAKLLGKLGLCFERHLDLGGGDVVQVFAPAS